MEHFIRLGISFAFLLIPAAVPATASADVQVAAPRAYTAVYEVLRNGEKVAKVTINLDRQENFLTLHGFTHDMQGLADLLKVKGEQSVRGTWQDGRFEPEKYDFLFSLIGYKSAWKAEYDWPAGIVTTRVKSDEFRLSLDSGAVDPLSLFMDTRSHLLAGQTHMEVDLIDADEIEHHVYVAELEEPVNTALGCFETTRVKRIRKNDKRTSLAWYANDHDYIPVMVQHRKKKGQGLTMKLTSLVIEGRQVPVSSACVADTP